MIITLFKQGHTQDLNKAYAIFFWATLLLFLFVSPGKGQETDTDTKSEVVKPPVEIMIWPEAKSILFKQVAILPLAKDDSPLPAQIRQTLYNLLDQAQLYPLLSLDTVDTFADADQAVGFSDNKSPVPAQGIISGVLQPLSPVSALGFKSLLTIQLTDIPTNKPVWAMMVKLPRENSEEPAHSLEQILDEGIKKLQHKLVEHGAIFSARIPSPNILTAQGTLRGARVILHPFPSSIHKSYQLMRADSKNEIFRLIGSPVENTTSPVILEDSELLDATTYYYSVVGFNAAGLASIPKIPLAITTTGRPGAVNNFTATGNGLRQIQLTWEPSSDPHVTGYFIYRRDTEQGPFEKIAEISDPEQQVYMDRGDASNFARHGKLADSTQYFYTIRSHNNFNVESDDAPVSSAKTKGGPRPPTDFMAVSNAARKIPLSWSAGTDTHTRGYILYRSNQAYGPFEKIAEVNGRLNIQYIDNGSQGAPLNDNARYYYKIRAENVVGTLSEFSKIISAVTKPAPSPVQGLLSSNNLVKQSVIKWHKNPEPDIKRYEIYRSNRFGVIGDKAGEVKADELLEFTDLNLQDGYRYWYSIRAINSDNLRGEFSDAVSSIVKACPSQPTGLRAEILANAIQLTWEQNSEKDIAHYIILLAGFIDKEIGQSDSNYFLFPITSKNVSEYRFRIKAVDQDGLSSTDSSPLTVHISGQQN